LHNAEIPQGRCVFARKLQSAFIGFARLGKLAALLQRRSQADIGQLAIRASLDRLRKSLAGLL
jgi:hypothetical protein